MRFQKGQSGNPGGRPKGIAAYVQAKCGKDGKKLVDALVLIAFSPNAQVSDRLKAANILLDRGWNKPSQGMYFSDEMRPLVVDAVSAADLATRRDTDAD